MVSQTRSQAVRQSLHLLISPSYTYSRVTVVPQTPDSAALSIKADKASPPPSPQMPDSVMFSVLCQYDFDAQESGMLSFRKGEILDVVKRDDTGWWAAMPKGGAVVGWIPQAFVRPLSNEMAEKLRNLDEEFRIPEFEAEELYNSSQTYESGAHVFDSDSDSPTSTYEDFFKSHSTSTVATSHHSRDTLQIVDESTLLSTSQSSSSKSRRHLHPPPSPISPMPVPPAGVSRSVSLDKSTPPTPPPKPDSKTRTGSLSNRHIRRRPVMVNDNPTLKQLSTLIETKDLKKIDEIASPDITGSFDAIFKHAREEKLQRKSSQTIKQTKKNHTPTTSLSKPRYLKPLYADQIDEDEKGHIRFASLPALIERLTTETGKADVTIFTEQAESSAFTNVFLTTFRTFTTADQLFELLVDRFNLKPPSSLTDTEYKDWKKNLREPVRRRILEVFNLWLTKHRLLDEEPHIARRLSSFLSTFSTGVYSESANKLIKEVERLTYTIPVSLLSPITPRKARKSKAHRNDLLKLDPVDIAEQLARWEFSLYVKITPQECLSYTKTKTGPKVVHLLDFCATHDKLGGWVKRSILKQDILPKRAETVEFWIKVAEKCRSLNNFASMSAIIIALSSMVIKNLHLTWSHVHRKSQLDQLLRHNEPTGGFAGYRLLAQNAEGACVPFISMYLTDLVHAQDQHKQSDGRICFFQQARWYEIITNILKFQSRPYSIVASESTALFIENNLGDVKDENWYWTRSQDLQQYEMAHADIRKGLEAAGF